MDKKIHAIISSAPATQLQTNQNVSGGKQKHASGKKKVSA